MSAAIENMGTATQTPAATASGIKVTGVQDLPTPNAFLAKLGAAREQFSGADGNNTRANQQLSSELRPLIDRLVQVNNVYNGVEVPSFVGQLLGFSPKRTVNQLQAEKSKLRLRSWQTGVVSDCEITTATTIQWVSGMSGAELATEDLPNLTPYLSRVAATEAALAEAINHLARIEHEFYSACVNLKELPVRLTDASVHRPNSQQERMVVDGFISEVNPHSQTDEAPDESSTGPQRVDYLTVIDMHGAGYPLNVYVDEKMRFQLITGLTQARP
jgi:hypothetical protein